MASSIRQGYPPFNSSYVGAVELTMRSDRELAERLEAEECNRRRVAVDETEANDRALALSLSYSTDDPAVVVCGSPRQQVQSYLHASFERFGRTGIYDTDEIEKSEVRFLLCRSHASFFSCRL